MTDARSPGGDVVSCLYCGHAVDPVTGAHADPARDAGHRAVALREAAPIPAVRRTHRPRDRAVTTRDITRDEFHATLARSSRPIGER